MLGGTVVSEKDNLCLNNFENAIICEVWKIYFKKQITLIIPSLKNIMESKNAKIFLPFQPPMVPPQDAHLVW